MHKLAAQNLPGNAQLPLAGQPLNLQILEFAHPGLTL
jgi:hypothetical protein